jgi:hypothetical protein
MNMSSDQLRALLSQCGEPTDGDADELKLHWDRVIGKRKRLDDLPISLDCPVCLEPVTPPIFQCEEGHIICEHCKKRVIRCPECRALLGKCRARLLEKIVEPLLVDCPNKGCNECVTLGHLQLHRKVCLHNVLTVCCVQCKWRGPLPDLIGHFHDCHPSSTIANDLRIDPMSAAYGVVKHPFNDQSVLNVDLDWVYEGITPALLMIRDQGNVLSVCVVHLAPDPELYRWHMIIGDLSVSGAPISAEALTDTFDPHKEATIMIPARVIRQVMGQTGCMAFKFFYNKEIE